VKVILCVLGFMLALAGPARAEELDDVNRFIAGRPELAAVAGKVATKVSTGVYRLELATGPTKLFIVQAGSTWAAALTVEPTALDLKTLIPAAVLGDAKLQTVALVVATGPETLAGEPFGAGDLGKLPVAAGVNIVVQLSIGTTGTLGQLAAAGVLPAKPMWITGTLGGGAVESLLAGKAPALGNLDYSITARISSFVPAPFSLIASPKLTLGDAAFTFARTGGAFTLAGEQSNSKLLIGSKTLQIPKTKLTFTTSGDGYDITVEGTSSEPPWRDAFGLKGVDLKSIGIVGTISKSGPQRAPIKGFGLGLAARVSIGKKDYDGEFSIKVENNALKELTLGLTGELGLGFLPGGKDFTFKSFGLAFTPASQQVALAGELQWRSLTGRAAVVLSKEPLLLFGVKGLNLTTLAGDKVPPGPALPTLDVLLTLGFAGKTGEVTNLPSVAQSLVDEFAGASTKVKIANGIGLVARGDSKAIGGEALGVTGPLLLAGSLDVTKGSFRLAATLPSMPKIPGLPAGFGVESPELFIAVDQKSGAPVASFGLALRLLIPDQKQRLAFTGSLAVSTAGSFAFTGSLDTNWENPFGLVGITVLAPVVVSVGINADASVDLGFQAGMAIAKQKYSPMAMCVNLQAGAPPVPKKLAFKFKGSELGPKAGLEVLEALVKSVINGPLKNATTDPATKNALTAIGPSVDKIGNAGDMIGIPSFSFKNVDVAVTTPGVTCNIPAIEGMGFKLAGTAVFQGKEIGAVDAYANLTQGFKIDAKVGPIDIAGLVKLGKAQLDILVPMPGMAPPPTAKENAKAEKLEARLAKRKKALKSTNSAIKKEKDAEDKAELVEDREDLEKEIESIEKAIARLTGPDYGHFYLSGKTEVLGSTASVKIVLDRYGAEFGFSAAIADLGSLALRAATEGESLDKATDFVVSLGAGNAAAEKFMKKLGAALKASAATRKQVQGDVSKGTEAAIKAAQDEYDRLDKTSGKDFRAATKALKKARKKLKKARRGIDKAKDKCEEDLGVAAALCGAMDAAKETLKVADRAVDATKKTLAEIKKSADYVRLGTLKTTIATLKAGKDLISQGLAGWAAVDRVGQMVVDGSANGIISLDEFELSGSLRNLRGELEVTLDVGETEIEREYGLALAPGQLDIAELVEEIANEISEQAVQKDSPVWKAMRQKK